jgi:para-aminobenzoate synthetase/4-amino-4-deoxychorismate lyase
MQEQRRSSYPEEIHALVSARADSVLLQTSRLDADNYKSYLFLDPCVILKAESAEELPDIFLQIEKHLAEGRYVAGYVSYEAGYHFQGVVENLQGESPLAWFGVYDEPAVFDHREGAFTGATLPSLPLPASPLASGMNPDDVALALNREAYGDKIKEIKERIASGATYQVNFTDRIALESSASPAELFGRLSRQQAVAYSAMIHAGGRHILSFSPELFFRVQDRRIVTRPMKGTWARGLDAAEDAVAALQLQNDEKNRSEHLMIVDLLRNDLGRVCETGSVRVDDLFSIERYETLLQMTSTVSGVLPHGLTWYELFRSLFPSGSITGAPKISTMEIIRELEESPRGVYTGAIGFFAPSGEATFNVAIRTLVLEDGRLSMGVGGGIVNDSEADAEYDECRLKASFLTRSQPEFELIETMLWDGVYTLLDLHLERLQLSAHYFGFAFELEKIVAEIERLAATFAPLSRHRVRMTLDKFGRIALTSAALVEASKICRVGVAQERTFSGDVFLRHKTTQRSLYERAFRLAQVEGFDEVLFLNERGEVTEGAISNVFARLDGTLVTPPVSCGLLPGVYRRHLLDAAPRAKERILTLEDLRVVEEIYLCNSVRGIRRVTAFDELPFVVTGRA